MASDSDQSTENPFLQFFQLEPGQDIDWSLYGQVNGPVTVRLVIRTHRHRRASRIPIPLRHHRLYLPQISCSIYLVLNSKQEAWPRFRTPIRTPSNNCRFHLPTLRQIPRKQGLLETAACLVRQHISVKSAIILQNGLWNIPDTIRKCTGSRVDVRCVHTLESALIKSKTI